MPRTKNDTGLPPRLFNRRGYYSYRPPNSAKEISFGKDRDAAISYATQANAVADDTKARLKQIELNESLAGLTLPEMDHRALLTHKAILKKAKKACVSGVYFLLLRREVVYIGQSRNCIKRIWQHTDKHFDAYTIIPAPLVELDALEAAYIAKFDPKHNKSIPADRGQSFAHLHIPISSGGEVRKNDKPETYPIESSTCAI